MKNSVVDLDVLTWIRMAFKTWEEFRGWVDSNLKRANVRSLRKALKLLVVEEVNAVGEDASTKLQREKLDYIKKVLSRLMGENEFNRLYSRFVSQITRQRQSEEARKATLRVDHEEVPFAKIRQEAVGHGGFNHGVLATHWDRIRWVYDCGSWRKQGRQALERRIEDFTRRCNRERNGHLELLFVSHFDADHVSGLKRLLISIPGETGTVVLPYLGSTGIFAVLCEAAWRGRCPQALIDQVINPVQWFQELGVQRVVQLRSDSSPLSGELAPIPDLPDRPPPEGVSPESLAVALLGPDRKLIKMRRLVKNGKTYESAIAKPGTVLGVTTPLNPRSQNQVLCWV